MSQKKRHSHSKGMTVTGDKVNQMFYYVQSWSHIFSKSSDFSTNIKGAQ